MCDIAGAPHPARCCPGRLGGKTSSNVVVLVLVRRSSRSERAKGRPHVRAQRALRQPRVLPHLVPVGASRRRPTPVRSRTQPTATRRCRRDLIPSPTSCLSPRLSTTVTERRGVRAQWRQRQRRTARSRSAWPRSGATMGSVGSGGRGRSLTSTSAGCNRRRHRWRASGLQSSSPRQPPPPPQRSDILTLIL